MPIAPLIESIPNFSEGRSRKNISAIVDHVTRNSLVRILDLSSDPDHHRSVLTMVGGLEEIHSGILALVGKAVELVDLRRHHGVHPRIGAVDVVPLVPIRSFSMEECVGLARRLGREIASRHSLPVYLYGMAARRKDRGNLADIRRGQFEGLPGKITSEEWTPDFGPAAVHPTAGATAVGARNPLIAYNVNLKPPDLETARRIARTLRQSSGGFPFVKAMGLVLRDRNIAQVSMNLENYRRTSIHQVFEKIRLEANRLGSRIVGSEIIGLIPREALQDSTGKELQIDGIGPDRILENRLREEPFPGDREEE